MSNRNQAGEGNREADKQYREDTREFVEKGKVDKAAKDAARQKPGEARKAEEKGRERAREEDPEVHREYDKPTKND